jgi:hypothetical protein
MLDRRTHDPRILERPSTHDPGTGRGKEEERAKSHQQKRSYSPEWYCHPVTYFVGQELLARRQPSSCLGRLRTAVGIEVTPCQKRAEVERTMATAIWILFTATSNSQCGSQKNSVCLSVSLCFSTKVLIFIFLVGVAGKVIGKKGIVITNLMRETQAKLINALQPIGNSLWVAVVIMGEASKCRLAYDAIENLVFQGTCKVTRNFIQPKEPNIYFF